MKQIETAVFVDRVNLGICYWEIRRGKINTGIRSPSRDSVMENVLLQSDRVRMERIVACVNACQGISTESLEDGVIEDLIKAAELTDKWLVAGFSDEDLEDGSWNVSFKKAGKAVRRALAKLKDTPND